MSMLTGIQEIDQETLMQMLRFSIRNGSNLMTFGPAGIGKTEMAMQACAAEGVPHLYLNLSVLEAPDLMGLPMVDESGETPVARYAPPRQFPLRANKDHQEVVLLVDEADKARPELQNPMLEMFQYRSINGVQFKIKAVVATGNLPDENSFSQPMSHALMNRCMVYKVTHSFDPWQQWAIGAGVNPLVIGFLASNSEKLLQPPPQGDDTAYCHPTPRSWTLAARDLDQAMDQGTDFQTLLIAGRVGQGAAVEFRVWLEHYRHIKPMIDALVQKGKAPDLGSADIDRVLVCAISGVDAIMRECRKHETQVNDQAIKDVQKVAKNVMGWLKDLPGEIQIGAVKSVLNMKVIQDYKLTKVKEFMDVYLSIRRVMQGS